VTAFGSSRAFFRSAPVLAAALLTGACLSTPELRVVENWLYCEECLTQSPADVPAELQAVERLRWRAVPLLAQTLMGPTRRQMTALESMLARDYDLIRDYRAQGISPAGVSLDSTLFVSHYVEGNVATLQKRAAVALWHIGTPSARAALRHALRLGSRRATPLRADIRMLLDTLNARPSP